MKTYEDFSQEGWFDKKSKEDPAKKGDMRAVAGFYKQIGKLLA